MIQKTISETSPSPMFSDEEILTEDEIEEYLDNLKSKLPSFVIILLKNNLRGKRVTKKQLDKIVERITEVLSKGRREDKTEELNKKLQTLEQKLDAIMKLTTMAVSTKTSEEIEKVKATEEIENVPIKIKSEEKPKKPVEIEEIEVSKKKEPIDAGKKTEEEVKEIEVPKPVEKPVEETHEKVKVEETKKEIKKEAKLEKYELPKELSMGGGFMTPIEGEKEYRLNDIPEDAVSMTLVFKWLEFLISKSGVTYLPDILDYYNKIGWISNKVILKLLRFAKNMKITYDEEELRPRDKLSPSDHIVSLLYIEKLAGRPIDPEVLEMLEIEIRRIKKWAMELQSI
ncbi:flagella protein [Methanocaldococcus sp. FS406-22]|uniref:FlaD/FlaE family flagellar protein n=1 Tax=Methanocaldococcus sp. (strain FS406-22) TaxID=644281 RepID=UPI0001BF4811|nr:FlaD/FlaE family flagellar protein [Methanocaldococcus sp. FS406-22]ADC69940.1 flagella protein [Methanocaldococcus sp. FS406-22]